jgi:nitroreductase
MQNRWDESIAEAWQQRYSQDGSPDIDSDRFLNHRSVRKFSEEILSRELQGYLVAAAQSASTSSNLQSWSVISVSDRDKKQALAEAAGNQKQVATAPFLCLFLADLYRLQTFARQNGIDPDGLDTIEMFLVACIDASLAAERMVCAAEAQGLGICYIGGMRNQPERVQLLLNLPEMTFAVFGLCIGYPAEGAEGAIKPRLNQDQVWFENGYPATLDSTDYDQRAHEFFVQHRMPHDAPWSQKCGQRAMTAGLSGREELMNFLLKQGFVKR